VPSKSEKPASAKILLAASKLFAEKGFSNASIRDICRESGTTAPVIYYYYGSKKGLFEAVVGEKVSMREFIETLAQSADEKGPERGLESFVQNYLAFFPENAFEPGLYMRDSASLDRRTANMISSDLDRIRTIASSLIQRGEERGVFRRTDPGLAADCLLGMLNRVIFQGIHFSKASDKEAYGKFVTEFFTRAMK
jgi:AcrR family transcriptional regulator